MGNRVWEQTGTIQEITGTVALIEKGKSSFLAHVHNNMDTCNITGGDIAILQYGKDSNKPPVLWGTMKQKSEEAYNNG